MEQEIFNAVMTLRKYGIELASINANETREATKLIMELMIFGEMTPIDRHARKAAFENAWFGMAPVVSVNDAPAASTTTEPKMLRSVELNGTVREAVDQG